MKFKAYLIFVCLAALAQSSAYSQNLTSKPPAIKNIVTPNQMVLEPGEEDSPSDGEPVKAQAFLVIPGALVCKSYDQFRMVLSLAEYNYKEHLMARINEKMYVLKHGSLPPEFNEEDYGCISVPAGTTFSVKYAYGMSVATIQTKVKGMVFRGVTDPRFYTKPNNGSRFNILGSPSDK